MKFVRACFGDDVDYTAQNAAKLRLIVVRIHFEFLDVVDDRRNRVRTAEAFLIVQSVQQKKIAPVRLAVNGGERKRPNGVASELLVAAVLRRIYSADARGQVQQLREVPPVQGEVVHGPLADHRAKLRTGCLDTCRGSLDHHSFSR